MHLIVGLGNPGLKYFKTRHNIGFVVIDRLAEFFKITSFTEESNYLYAVGKYRDKQVVLMKPLTYMNSSGRAVKEFYDKYEISLENILIVYDDVNLDFGVIRLRPGGSDGGQNGIKSIIYEMQTEDIARLRIGIKNPEELEKLKTGDGYELADYVLSEFIESEIEDLGEIIETSKDAAFSFIEDGIKETMNRFNKNILGENNNN
jgi:PTH1 family peptidyl-tRNA hydrolase